MVKIYHFVTLLSWNVTHYLSLNYLSLMGYFQFLVPFGVHNIVLVLSWTTQYGIVPAPFHMPFIVM